MAEPTFLYDGDCAFCSSCARFLRRWVPTPATIEAWQLTELDRLGVTALQCDAAVQWIAGTEVGAGPVAIAALLRSSTLPWRIVGRLLAIRPVIALAWPVYRWVARNRDRMPGGTAACALPAAQREWGGTGR